MKLALIYQKWQRDVIANKAKVTEYAEKLLEAELPAHTLEWGSDVYTAAARLQTTLEVIKAVEAEFSVKQLADESLELEGEFLANLQEFFLKAAINGARWPKFSTSVVSDYMHQMEVASWADMYNLLRGNSL